jgi:hypothetical protein
MVGVLFFYQFVSEGNKMSKNVLFLAICVCGLVACASSDTSNAAIPFSAENAALSLRSDGLSCRLQDVITAFEEKDRTLFIRLAKNNMTEEELSLAIRDRQVGCRKNGDVSSVPSTTSPVIEVSTHAITNTYVVERIEEQATSGYGWMASSVYRDGANYGDMCGTDWPRDYWSGPRILDTVSHFAAL